MQKIKLYGTIGMALLILIVIIQNVGAVETKLLLWSVTMPNALMLFVSVLTGFLMGVVFATVRSSGRS